MEWRQKSDVRLIVDWIGVEWGRIRKTVIHIQNPPFYEVAPSKRGATSGYRRDGLAKTAMFVINKQSLLAGGTWNYYSVTYKAGETFGRFRRFLSSEVVV